jgi:hypothetical protein
LLVGLQLRINAVEPGANLVDAEDYRALIERHGGRFRPLVRPF